MHHSYWVVYFIIKSMFEENFRYTHICGENIIVFLKLAWFTGVFQVEVIAIFYGKFLYYGFSRIFYYKIIYIYFKS